MVSSAATRVVGAVGRVLVGSVGNDLEFGSWGRSRVPQGPGVLVDAIQFNATRYSTIHYDTHYNRDGTSSSSVGRSGWFDITRTSDMLVTPVATIMQRRLAPGSFVATEEKVARICQGGVGVWRSACGGVSGGVSGGVRGTLETLVKPDESSPRVFLGVVPYTTLQHNKMQYKKIRYTPRRLSP